MEKGVINAIKDTSSVATGALGVALHLTRIMANRGLISPNEVETIFSMLMESMETIGTQELQANTETNLGPMMAEIRLFARERWIGKDHPDPEPRPGRSS